MAQTRTNEATGQGADIKKGTFLFQSIETINVSKVKELKDIVDGESESTVRITGYLMSCLLSCSGGPQIPERDISAFDRCARPYRRRVHKL